MIPEDMMAALGGGAGGGALPPDMAALLGGGGGGAPVEENVPSGALHGGSAAEGDPEDAYREALDALEAGMKMDTDEQRINVVMQCAAKIQGELAGTQKVSDGMLAGKVDPAGMRRMGAADESY